MKYLYYDEAGKLKANLGVDLLEAAAELYKLALELESTVHIDFSGLPLYGFPRKHPSYSLWLYEEMRRAQNPPASPEVYRLAPDGDGHWYLVPESRRDAWNAWCQAWENYESTQEGPEPNPDPPDGITRLSRRPSGVRFREPEIDS